VQDRQRARAALDPEQLRDLQLERLRTALALVANTVPHYMLAFREAGVVPDDIRRLEDISNLPFTTKDHLRRAYPVGMFAVPREEISRIHVSSGTTGTPTVVGYTARDLETWTGLMARSLATAGAVPGDLVHNAYGYGLFTGGLGFHYGSERLGATVLPVSGGATERQVQLIRDFRPSILLATPSYMLVIADELTRQGIGPEANGLRLAVFGAEPCSEALRTEIETRLGVTALDCYGLSEVMGPGVAQERGEDRGSLMLWEDHFYPEIIDPDTGRVLPDGETGELVLTTLTKEGMPVIRYRTRDRTSLLPPTNGPMRRLKRIAGRTDDMLIIRGVNVFPSQIEELICREERLSPHYLIEVSRPQRLDEIRIRIEIRDDLAASAESARLAVAQRLERRIKELIGISASVMIENPLTIERSAGKAKRVVDLRPKG
jgi:phenylacetate-CoA ligase